MSLLLKLFLMSLGFVFAFWVYSINEMHGTMLAGLILLQLIE